MSRREFCALALAGLSPHAAVADPSSTPTRATSNKPVHLPLRVERGKPYFMDAEGQPFLLHGDTAWSLVADPSREGAILYLDDRRQRGFNTILVNLIEHKFARNAPANAYGAAPFTVKGDFTTPNDAYFQHAGWVLDEAAARGLVVLLAPAYLGAPDTDEGWYQEMRAAGPDKLREYGRFLGRRYGERKNVLWMHGGDRNPDDRSVVIAVVDGIRETAPNSIHSAHCISNTTASDFWGDQNWLDFNTLYTYGSVYLKARDALGFRARGPTVMLESAYENEHGADALRVRMQAYQALLTGATGHVFGNHPIWHFDGPGVFKSTQSWQSALGSAGARSMEVMVALFNSAKWWTLEPDSDGRLLKGGIGDDASRAVAASTADSRMALVYLPDRRQIEVNFGALVGPEIELSWFDPATGNTAARSIVARSSGAQALTPPLTLSMQDWVLVLRSRGT